MSTFSKELSASALRASAPLIGTLEVIVSRTRAVALAGISALVGSVIGAGAALWFGWSFLEQATIDNSIVKLQVGSSILEKLSAGDSDSATSLINMVLDGELVFVASLAHSGRNIAPQTLRSIATVARIRKESGYVPANGEVRQLVDAALALSEEQR